MLLQLKNLEKSYGENHVLRGLNCQVESGSAMALLGRNGAGKTTTIRLIMDIFDPDRGQILLDGQPLKDSAVKIGYLPEERGLYAKQKILRQLIYIGELRNLRYEEAKRRALAWLDRLNMTEHAEHKLETLSKGNQQKIQLAVCLIHDPDLIILDEPFSGLDPVNANVLKEIIQEEISRDKLVFFSSHQMSYVEDICEHMALLYQGQISLQGSIKDIRRTTGKRNHIYLQLKRDRQFLTPEATVKAVEDLKAAGGISVPLEAVKVFKEGAEVSLQDPQEQDQLLQEFSQSSYSIDHFSIIEPALTDIFIQYTGGNAMDEQEEVLSHAE